MSSSATDAIRSLKPSRSSSRTKAARTQARQKRVRSQRSSGQRRLSNRFFVALFFFLAGSAGFVSVLTSILNS